MRDSELSAFQRQEALRRIAAGETYADIARTYGVDHGEPVFAAKPGGAPNEGWLLVQVVDGSARRAYFAILDAQTVEHGPVAKSGCRTLFPSAFTARGCRPDVKACRIVQALAAT